jgi:imidazoleglycerol-phosphate dehydratase
VSRTAEVRRSTLTTTVVVRLALDGRGRASARTGIAGFDELLEVIAAHGRFDLDVEAVTQGADRVELDAHRVVVTTAGALGEAFATALGPREGVRGLGEATVPVAGALVRAACDLGGRGILEYHAAPPAWQMISDYDVSLTPEFWQVFAVEARVTLHLDRLRGEHGRQITEAAFAAAARAVASGAERDPRIGPAGGAGHERRGASP